MTLRVQSYVGSNEGSEEITLEEQVLLTQDGIALSSTSPLEQNWA